MHRPAAQNTDTAPWSRSQGRQQQSDEHSAGTASDSGPQQEGPRSSFRYRRQRGRQGRQHQNTPSTNNQPDMIRPLCLRQRQWRSCGTCSYSSSGIRTHGARHSTRCPSFPSAVPHRACGRSNRALRSQGRCCHRLWWAMRFPWGRLSPTLWAWRRDLLEWEPGSPLLHAVREARQVGVGVGTGVAVMAVLVAAQAVAVVGARGGVGVGIRTEAAIRLRRRR